MNKYEIVASGKKWIGQGIRSTNHVINELIDESYEKILLTIFVVTDKEILNNIEAALKRKIEVDILINVDENDLINENILKELIKFKSEYENLNLYKIIEEKIHAKIVIADGKKLLIGSANLTYHGLNKNYELGILIEDSEVAYDVETIIKRLIE